MKVLLVTSFEEYFLAQDTRPALERRGVEIAAEFAAKDVDSYDLEKYKAEGVELILHMNEVGGHDASKRLSTRAHNAGLPVKALSRKKASWNFLPPPRDLDPPSLPQPPPPPPSGIERVLDAIEEVLVYDIEASGRSLRMHADPSTLLMAANTPENERVAEFMIETNFNRKEARLRDVVQLVIAHGVTEYETVLNAIDQGRKRGIFPRLARSLKAEQLPKLVKSMLAHELNLLKEEKDEGKVRAIHLYKEDAPLLQSIGLDTSEGPRKVDTHAGLKQFDNDPEINMQKTDTPLRLATTAAPPSPADIRAAMISWGKLMVSLKASPHAEQFARFLAVAKSGGMTLDDVIEALSDD